MIGVLSVFGIDVFVDEIHGARSIEGVQGDEVFYRIGFGAFQDILHARGFELENRGAFAFSQQLEGLPVVLGDIAFHEIDAPLLKEIERVFYEGQGLESEKIHFDKAAILEVIHRVLGGDIAGLGILVERHKIGEFGFADDDASRVDGAVSVQVLEAQANFEEFLIARILSQTA